MSRRQTLPTRFGRRMKCRRSLVFIARRIKPVEINEQRVPENLRDLVPLAEKWGIGDDVIRSDCEDKATEEERGELRDALHGRTAEVEAWLDSSPAGLLPNEEAGSFLFM